MIVCTSPPVLMTPNIHASHLFPVVHCRSIVRALWFGWPSAVGWMMAHDPAVVLALGNAPSIRSSGNGNLWVGSQGVASSASDGVAPGRLFNLDRKSASTKSLPDL